MDLEHQENNNQLDYDWLKDNSNHEGDVDISKMYPTSTGVNFNEFLGRVDVDKHELDKEHIHEGYISWDETWIEICKVIARRSKDPKRKIGALIVNDENKIISLGYNGMPRVKEGLDNDKVYPWGKNDIDINNTKYPYVVHAELNAILNATQSVKNCTLYVTYNCCNECCKAIVQSGIKKVVYMTKRDKSIYITGRKILENAGIEVIEYKEKIEET